MISLPAPAICRGYARSGMLVLMRVLGSLVGYPAVVSLVWPRDQACMTGSAHCEVNANENNIWPCKQATVSTQFRAGTVQSSNARRPFRNQLRASTHTQNKLRHLRWNGERLRVGATRRCSSLTTSKPASGKPILVNEWTSECRKGVCMARRGRELQLLDATEELEAAFW